MTPPVLGLIALALLGSQSPAPKTSPAAAAATPATFEMTVKGGLLGTVSIEAKQIQTKLIVERLKTEFKIPVDATQIVSQHKVDLSLKDASVFVLLSTLAPVVLADQEIAPGEEPVWTGIHLVGFNEKEPAGPLKQSGFLVFAGALPGSGKETPEELEAKTAEKERASLDEPPKDEKPVLVVSVDASQRVSLRARKQPLIAILNGIALKAKTPIDLRGQVDLVPIDIDIRDTPLRDIGAALGRGGFRLAVRRNLATGEERVQGILVGEPARPPVS